MQLNRKNNSVTTFLVLVIAIFLNSCDNEFEAYDIAISKTIVDSDIIEGKDYVIVIPGEGCGGCISSATSFVVLNPELFENSVIIFTGVMDEKLLRNQVGSDFLKRGNVLVDSDNYLMSRDIKSVYPYVLEIANRKAKDFILFDDSEFVG